MKKALGCLFYRISVIPSTAQEEHTMGIAHTYEQLSYIVVTMARKIGEVQAELVRRVTSVDLNLCKYQNAKSAFLFHI